MTDTPKRHVFLDDYRVPGDAFDYTHNPIYNKLKWVVVRSYDEFVNDVLTNGLSDTYSFDHDLADIHYEHQDHIDYDTFTEKTGYDCAKWLIYYCMDNNLELPKNIYIHSRNVAGSKNIKSLFESYLKSLGL